VSGSHHLFVYREEQTYRSIAIPLHGRKVKKIYVEKALDLIDELFPIEGETNEEEDDEQDA